MEEFRDERLGKIMSWMQSWARGYLSRKEFKKMQEQRLALQVIQRNLRKYMQLRTWPWWKLWQKVKPMLNVTRIEDEIAVRIQIFSTFIVTFIFFKFIFTFGYLFLYFFKFIFIFSKFIFTFLFIFNLYIFIFYIMVL